MRLYERTFSLTPDLLWMLAVYFAAALAEETALTVEDVELTERGDGVMALRVLLTADGESATLEMTVRGA